MCTLEVNLQQYIQSPRAVHGCRPPRTKSAIRDLRTDSKTVLKDLSDAVLIFFIFFNFTHFSVERSPSARLLRGDTKALRIPYRAPRAHSKWPAHTRDSRAGAGHAAGLAGASVSSLSTNLQGAGWDSHLPAANGRGCRRGRYGPQGVGMTHEPAPENEAAGHR